MTSMENQQYIAPEVRVLTFFSENTLVTNSGEPYDSEMGSW